MAAGYLPSSISDERLETARDSELAERKGCEEMTLACWSLVCSGGCCWSVLCRSLEWARELTEKLVGVPLAVVTLTPGWP